jgi:hypothetical protein
MKKKSVIEKIKKHGLLGILDYLAHSIFKTYWINIHFLKTNINYDKILSQLENTDFKFKELKYNDFLLGDPNEFTKKKLKIIKNRLENNTHRCYGFLDKNTLAYSCWISLDKIELPIISSNFNLSNDEGFLYDAFCHPLYRGKGLHSNFNLFRMKSLYELGKRECLVFVFKGNTSALRVQYKCGFIDLGSFKVGKIFAINFTTLKKNRFDKLFELKSQLINNSQEINVI